MKTQILKTLTIVALATVGFLATPQQAQAGYPVMDIGNIVQSTSSAISDAGQWATGIAHKAADGIAWAADYVEQQLQSGLLGYIEVLNEAMRTIQDDINQAAGTVSAIAGLPKNIMNDIMGIIGSVKDTIMQVAGVAGIWDEVQDVVKDVSNIEALGSNLSGGNLLDFGKFNNAYGAYSTIRGIQTRTAVEHLNQIDDERQVVERTIGTFENSTNAAAIAKGHAQLAAAQWREAARANEMASIAAQAKTAESWSREASARSRAAVQSASTADMLINDTD